MPAPTGLSGLMDALKSKRSLTHFVYKEPALAAAPGWTRTALPDARIILIHRDGRDVASSLVKSYNVLNDAALKNASAWPSKFVGRSFDDRYVPWWIDEGEEEKFFQSSQFVRAAWNWAILVRLCQDQLVKSDLAESGKLHVVYYEELMRNPKEIGLQIADFVNIKPTKRFLKKLESAHTKSIGKYKSWPVEDIENAEHIAETELRELGYLNDEISLS